MKYPKISIAICGSAGGEHLENVNERCRILGKEMAKRGVIAFSGAGNGYPHKVIASCFEHGGITIGISPASSLSDHRDNLQYPTDHLTSIIYTGVGIKGRNVLLVGSSNVIICIGGGIGTLNEFTIAYDEGKPVGVLQGSGGLSEDYRSISQKAYEKKRHSKIVIEESDPIALLDKVLSTIKR